MNDNEAPHFRPRHLLYTLGAIVAVVVAFNFLLSLHAVGPGDVCVVQEGGPLDGRGVAEIRHPSSGVKPVGIFNKQRCFPATQRNYIVSSKPEKGDEHGVDFVEVPTLDAVNVRIEGAAYFTLNTSPDAVEAFYRQYGARTFDGKHPYDDDGGWSSFLDQNFRPVLDNALREAIGSYRCVELNNTCQYVTQAQSAVEGNVKQVNTAQNIAAVQNQIGKTLAQDLNESLHAPPGEPYFTNVRFRLRIVTYDGATLSRVREAIAARTQVATARLRGQQRVEAATQDKLAAMQRAQAIRATRNAYRDNPAMARIDTIKALPRDLQALGSGFSVLVGGR
jgi:SPFH domain / Band 7 family